MQQLVPYQMPEELVPLLARQVSLFNMGDTSLPIETAGELAAGVLYCVQLGGGTTQRQFAAGQKKAVQLAAQCKTLLHAVRQTAVQNPNIAYTDTLAGIGAGLTAYNPRFFPHRVPGDIDYPLCIPVDEALQGCEYLRAYLRQLLAENQLCACFDANAHAALLAAAGPGHRHLVRSITQPLLLNATALLVLGRRPLPLDITPADRLALEPLLTEVNWRQAATHLPAALGIHGEDTGQYLTQAAQALWPVHRGLLHSLAYVAGTPPPAITDASGLPGDVLRAMLEEMRTCRHTSDRLAMLAREIHSAADLAEALHYAIPPEEQAQVYPTLDDPTLAMLCALATQRKEEPWTRQLAAYIACLPVARRQTVRRLESLTYFSD